VIVQSPVSEVRAERARFSGGGAARITIGGDRYTIAAARASLLSSTRGR
jgi:hypothetical protein